MTLLSPITAAGVEPGAPRDMRVVAVREGARGTKLYDLAPRDGGLPPPATPGAHVDLYLPNGLVRQYSLVSARPGPVYTLGIKRDAASRGGSTYVHDHVGPGDILRVGAPRNNFPLLDTPGPVLLIGGGIGITPLMAMAEALGDRGADWQLVYACRSRDEALFLDRLDGDPRVTLHFDDAAGGRALDLASLLRGRPRDLHVYCCGPAPMLAALEAATADFPAGQVHVEHFTATQEAATEGGFTVELARSGVSFDVAPGQTILEALRDAGLDVPTSCEQGVCGMCETMVLEGEPDHRDEVLTEAERAAGDRMMICCSGCRGSRLVLDI